MFSLDHPRRAFRNHRHRHRHRHLCRHVLLGGLRLLLVLAPCFRLLQLHVGLWVQVWLVPTELVLMMPPLLMAPTSLVDTHNGINMGGTSACALTQKAAAVKDRCRSTFAVPDGVTVPSTSALDHVQPVALRVLLRALLCFVLTDHDP